jgi:hypothetical protein
MGNHDSYSDCQATNGECPESFLGSNVQGAV